MCPVLARDDEMNGSPVDAILACELALAGGPGGMGGADGKDLCIGQLGTAVTFAARPAAAGPALSHRISDVILVRA